MALVACPVAAGRTHLFLTIHHAIGDGWSLVVLGADLLAYYQAIVDGAEARLPTLASSWWDVVAWHLAERPAERWSVLPAASGWMAPARRALAPPRTS